MSKRLVQSVFLLGWLDFPCKLLSPIALDSQRGDGKSVSTETQEDEGHVQDSNTWIASAENLTGSWSALWTSTDRCQKDIIISFSESALHSVPVQCSWLVGNGQSEDCPPSLSNDLRKRQRTTKRKEKSLYSFIFSTSVMFWA